MCSLVIHVCAHLLFTLPDVFICTMCSLVLCVHSVFMPPDVFTCITCHLLFMPPNVLTYKYLSLLNIVIIITSGIMIVDANGAKGIV